MKFNINRETILPPLGQVIGAVERRHTLPILANVLLKSVGGILTLTSTDLEIEIYAVDDKDKYDPQGKSKKTKPGKPAIFLE